MAQHGGRLLRKLAGAPVRFLILMVLVEQVRGHTGRQSVEGPAARDTAWRFRRSVEAEVLLGIGILQQAMAQLGQVEAGGHWKGKHRYLYISAGRGLRLADGLQSSLLEMLHQRRFCTNCAKDARY